MTDWPILWQPNAWAPPLHTRQLIPPYVTMYQVPNSVWIYVLTTVYCPSVYFSLKCYPYCFYGLIGGKHIIHIVGYVPKHLSEILGGDLYHKKINCTGRHLPGIKQMIIWWGGVPTKHHMLGVWGFPHPECTSRSPRLLGSWVAPHGGSEWTHHHIQHCIVCHEK